MIHRSYGGPEVLELAEPPAPKAHVDSVMVRVEAAAINPADLALQAGALDGAVDTYFPVIPGWDIAGVVKSAGPGAGEFAPGDEVVGYIRADVQHAHGGLAELVSADARTVAHKPRSMGFIEASALPLAGLTAYQAVVRALDVYPGETLLVHGAAGGVGSLAAQIGRTRGAHVIGTAAERDHPYLRSLGVTPVRYGDGVADRVLALVPAGVDAVLDTAGTRLPTTPASRPRARLASVAGRAQPGVTAVFCRLDQDDLKAVAHLADSGRLRVPIGATFPLEQAAEAQRALAAGGTGGRVVVTIGGRSAED